MSLQKLRNLGVAYWRVEGDATNPNPKLDRIRQERGYNNFDVIELHKDRLPNYEAKIKMFFEGALRGFEMEHILRPFFYLVFFFHRALAR